MSHDKCNQGEISFTSEDMNGLSIKFCEVAAKKLDGFKQGHGYSEAGGMLFAELQKDTVLIRDISVPCNLDLSSSTSFVMNEKHMVKTISDMYRKKRLHYVGDWHTHSECVPTPSFTDIGSIRQAFRSSRHDLNFFIMLIVSNKNFKNSYLALTDGKKEFQFNAAMG